jgi:chromate reductase
LWVIQRVKRRIRAADAILVVAPEYNYSVRGVLKSSIDWASRPYGDSAWEGKRDAIMRASSGALGTARAPYHLRQPAENGFDADGNITHEPTKQIIRDLLKTLMDWAG